MNLQTNFVLRAITLVALGLIVSASLAAQAPEKSAVRTWEYGPFFNGGVGVGDRSDFKFIWTGVQAGRILTPNLKAGVFSGNFELGGEIIPFFQSYTPAPHTLTVDTPNGPVVYQIGGGTFTGFSVAPVIFRWNFKEHGRFQPWFQAKGAVLYTTHKFPPDVLVPHGQPGGTSVWNFMPQGGIGFHYFTRPNRSIDLGINAVHISSASLGDKNPGVNASMQFQLGYTFWK